MDMQKYNIFYLLFRGYITVEEAMRELARLDRQDNEQARQVTERVKRVFLVPTPKKKLPVH